MGVPAQVAERSEDSFKKNALLKGCGKRDDADLIAIVLTVWIISTRTNDR
jgi:hypothetical protein